LYEIYGTFYFVVFLKLCTKSNSLNVICIAFSGIFETKFYLLLIPNFFCSVGLKFCSICKESGKTKLVNAATMRNQLYLVISEGLNRCIKLKFVKPLESLITGLFFWKDFRDKMVGLIHHYHHHHHTGATACIQPNYTLVDVLLPQETVWCNSNPDSGYPF